MIKIDVSPANHWHRHRAIAVMIYSVIVLKDGKITGLAADEDRDYAIEQAVELHRRAVKAKARTRRRLGK